MDKNIELRKLYDAFTKALSDLKGALDSSEPSSAVLRAGKIGLFEFCCDRSYVFMRNFLEWQGYSFPVTAAPYMIADCAMKCGIVEDSREWTHLFEFRNSLFYDTDNMDLTLSAIVSIPGIYIPLFEKLKQNIDENWLN